MFLFFFSKAQMPTNALDHASSSQLVNYWQSISLASPILTKVNLLFNQEVSSWDKESFFASLSWVDNGNIKLACVFVWFVFGVVSLIWAPREKPAQAP